MSQSINIQVLNIKDDLIHYQIEVTNGITSNSLDFYANKNEFIEFGNQLKQFPSNIKEEVIYELGEKDKHSAYYMLMKVYCYQPYGYTAINVKIENGGTDPYHNKAVFSITTMPASINKLGKILSSWNPKIESEIEWIAE